MAVVCDASTARLCWSPQRSSSDRLHPQHCQHQRRAAGPADRGALQRRRLQRQRLGVGRFGVLLAMVRADGAGPHTAEASHAKTFTSASSRNPTSGIAKAIQSNPDAAGMANIPGFLVLGGGVPLKIGNETLVPLVPLAWPVRLAAIWTKPALIRPSPR
nr:heme-binding protein [Comamonas thiooxydans]